MNRRLRDECPADCECDECWRPVARPVTSADLAAWASHDALHRAWMAEDEAHRQRMITGEVLLQRSPGAYPETLAADGAPIDWSTVVDGVEVLT